MPETWASAELGELAEIKLGKMLDKAKNKGQLTPYLRNINVRWGAFDLSDISQMPMSSEERATLSIGNGDILVCEGGEPGRSAVWDQGQTDLAFQKALMRVRPYQGVEPKLLAFFLRKSYDNGELERHFTGTTIKHLPQFALSRLSLSLPPAAEQRRIVAKIDSLTGKSRRARDRLDHIPRLVEKYKQAVLAAAFRGDLTRRWREEHALEWPEMSLLDKLCVSVSDGDHQAPPKATSGIPFITISAMNNGIIDLDKATRFVPKAYFDSLGATRRASRGDVLFSVAGSFGIAALVDFDDPFVFQRHIAILKPNAQSIDAKFLFRMLSSGEIALQADNVATGTAQRTVPLSGLRKFSIPAPSILEQRRIVQRIEAAFTWIDRLAAEATSARKLIDRLDQAVLAKAFRGELVPQDPNDEPASVLLERIKAERGVAPKAKRRAKR